MPFIVEPERDPFNLNLRKLRQQWWDKYRATHTYDEENQVWRSNETVNTTRYSKPTVFPPKPREITRQSGERNYPVAHAVDQYATPVPIEFDPERHAWVKKRGSMQGADVLGWAEYEFTPIVPRSTAANWEEARKVLARREIERTGEIKGGGGGPSTKR
jgi:hypothetical protein